MSFNLLLQANPTGPASTLGTANPVSIAIFFLFVAVTLYITYWAAKKTKTGSSLLIMSIVGGAIFPVIMGRVSDLSNIQLAYLVPAACFIVVLLFSIKNAGKDKIKLEPMVSH